MKDRWDGGRDYDVFMGRWSRQVAEDFVRRVDASAHLRWLDVGCGTGALLGAVLESASPAEAVGVDPSREFVEAAQKRLGGRARLQIAAGGSLPFDDNIFDVVVSGFALNFIPDPLAAVREWVRVTRQGGAIHVYVWDYANGMEFLRYFWDAVVGLDPAAKDLDEGVRFPICQPGPLAEIFEQAGLSEVRSGSITVATHFSDFDDFWAPFLRGQGPAPGYVVGLANDDRARLKDQLMTAIPQSPEGAIDLTAKAWTVTGTA